MLGVFLAQSSAKIVHGTKPGPRQKMAQGFDILHVALSSGIL